MNKPNIDSNFKTNKLYRFDIDKYLNNQLSKKETLTGVQKKLSYKADTDKSKITLINRKYQYIIKPNTSDYPYIAEAEFLNMQLANICGISTPAYNLIKINNKVNAFVVKRMDRNNNMKIHMEDFAQLSGRGSEYKYEYSIEKCLKLIDKYSSIPEIDKAEFIYRCLFCYLTLNSDMHLKNFSFIEDDMNILSPAYDMVPTNLLLPSDLDDVALTLNGKKRHLRRKDFMSLNRFLDINGSKIINNLIIKLSSNKDEIIKCIQESFIPDSKKKEYIKLFKKRLDILTC